MPNVKRVILPGEPHHLTQRGNYRQQIFFRPSDRRLYLDLLREFSREFDVSIQGYCLMPNHVHVIATPHDPLGLARCFERVHSEYARDIHIRLRRRGHLFQARYRSFPMDQGHFWTALVYVEQNPVRAGLCAFAEQYRWSSAAARLQGHDEGFLDLAPWRAKYSVGQWLDRLRLGLDDAAELDRIRAATRAGRPLAHHAILAEWEQRLGRSLQGKLGGRPRKSATSETVRRVKAAAVAS